MKNILSGFARAQLGTFAAIIMWTETNLSFKCVCKECDKVCCCHTLSKLVKAAFIGLLWAVSLLIDGDWYVCCRDNRKLACKREPNITAEEQTAIAELKIQSWIIGIVILCGILVLAAIISATTGETTVATTGETATGATGAASAKPKPPAGSPLTAEDRIPLREPKLEEDPLGQNLHQARIHHHHETSADHR